MMPQLSENPATDTLAYKFIPAGHKTPPQEREYPEPDRRLAQAFEEWLELDIMGINCFKLYEKALELAKDVRAPVEESNSLLLRYQDRPNMERAGIFLSAIYNQVRDSEIVFDLEPAMPPDFLGYMLAKGKRLVNLGRAGSDMGKGANASVINMGTVGWRLGEEARAPVINLGNASFWMGSYACSPIINLGVAEGSMGHMARSLILNLGTVADDMGSQACGTVVNLGVARHALGDSANAPVINLGTAGIGMGNDANDMVLAAKDPESFGNLSHAKNVLKEKDCEKIPELLEYLQDTKTAFEAGRNDYHKILEYLDSLGPEPGKRIEADIKEILRRSGYDI